ncbi:MAG TPA: mannosyltransferase family protein [Solirubrobacteraceae bacterium]|nr:mannosyltransferase family protein [Solirubrobacteraceae bacterium]
MAVEPAQEAAEVVHSDAAVASPPTLPAVRRRARARRPSRGLDRVAAAYARLRWPLAVYLSSRVLYFLLAIMVSLVQHWSLKAELSNWDGVWYRRLTGMGYPDHVLHVQSTLGFFPLYPMLTWLVQHALVCSIFLAGVLISGVGGFIATLLVQRLAAGWWGEEASRRAVILFCFFPGSVVFSMVYSEGVLLPLVAGCLLALERRRWVLAGVLAAFATAVGPTAVPIILACGIAALLEIRRHGWKAKKALIAPLLAPVGIIAFGIFLWAWTGSPFASYYAQHHEWGEKTNPLALVTLVLRLINESYFTRTFVHINLNYIAGLVGAVFLFYGLYLLAKTRPRISPAALVWTLGIAFLAVTSENVPPNPRLLITAFPAVLVVAYRFTGERFRRVMQISIILLIVMSAASFVSTALRP